MKTATLPRPQSMQRRQSLGGRVARIVLTALAALTVVVLAVTGVSELLFRQMVERDVASLFARNKGVAPGPITDADLAGLPAPVQKWLRFSGVVGHERVATVRLRQSGLFRTGPDQPWGPLEAEQYFTVNPPGFVWSARMQAGPALWIRARDQYVEGRGNMFVKLLSVVPLSNATGPGMDQGAMLRYLGEMAWFPTAALSDTIKWEAVDEQTARATMSYGGVTASAVFSFDANGVMTNMVAQRFHEASGSMQTWSAPMAPDPGFKEFDGLKITTRGQAVWNLSAGDMPYIQFENRDVETNVPELWR